MLLLLHPIPVPGLQASSLCSHTIEVCSPPGHRSVCPRPDQTARFSQHGSIGCLAGGCAAAAVLAVSADVAMGRSLLAAVSGLLRGLLDGVMGIEGLTAGLAEDTVLKIAANQPWKDCLGTLWSAWCNSGAVAMTLSTQAGGAHAEVLVYSVVGTVIKLDASDVP